MISLEDFKKILESKNIDVPDDKIKVLRDAMDTLADKIYDDWLLEEATSQPVDALEGNNTVHCS